MNKMTDKLLWLFIALPYIYVAAIWKSLPDRLPMHFGSDGNPDRIGNKSELITVLLIMTAIVLFSYYMVAYAYKIDPKKYAALNKDKMKKIAAAVAFFTLLTMGFAIYSITRGSVKMEVKFVFAAIGILYAVIGNYMHSLKPNYFVGVRVPWTLEDPENWRKTHLLAGKWWFAGGLILATACMLVSSRIAGILMPAVTAVLCIVPIVYSYFLFRRSGHGHEKEIN